MPILTPIFRCALSLPAFENNPSCVLFVKYMYIYDLQLASFDLIHMITNANFYRYKGPEHVGTFLDRPIPEQEEPDTSRVKQLAALMSQRSQSTPEGIN